MDLFPLQSRLQRLSESLKRTQQLIKRLSNLSSSAPASFGGAEEDENEARAELADEIHQGLKEQEDDYELISQDAEDLADTTSAARRRGTLSARDRERTDLACLVTKLGEDLKTTRSQFRKAQLQAKRDADAAKRRERELLYQEIKTAPPPPPLETESDRIGDPKDGSITQSNGEKPASSLFHPRRSGRNNANNSSNNQPQTRDSMLLSASSDVTASLRRTHDLMAAELQRSQFARETLEASTRELSSLSESYTNLDTLLSSSKSLVGTLINSRKSDTWYLETTLYILVATIGWLVFRRILYGPGWWLIYQPLRWTWWFLWTLIVTPASSCFGLCARGAGQGSSGSAGLALNSSIQTSVMLVSGSSITTTIVAATASSTQVMSGVNSQGIPTFRSDDMPQPSIRVGGGGRGANPNGGGPPPVADTEDSRQGNAGAGAAEGEGGQAVDAAGSENDDRAAAVRDEQSQGNEREGTVLRERRPEDGPPNRKKRMWEEPPPDSTGRGGDRPRDEL